MSLNILILLILLILSALLPFTLYWKCIWLTKGFEQDAKKGTLHISGWSKIRGKDFLLRQTIPVKLSIYDNCLSIKPIIGKARFLTYNRIAKIDMLSATWGLTKEIAIIPHEPNQLRTIIISKSSTKLDELAHLLNKAINESANFRL